MLTCASCGTTYQAPVSGPPFCPNNNCSMHQGAAGPATARAQADLALKEAATWLQAVKDAEAHLTDVRAKAQAAQAAVQAKLRDAAAQAQAELDAIGAMEQGLP
jgi:hypothetical protein